MKIRNVFNKVQTQKQIEQTPEVSASTAKLKEKAQQNASDKLYRWRKANSKLHSLHSLCISLEKKWQQKSRHMWDDVDDFCQRYNLAIEYLEELAQKEPQFSIDMVEKVESTIKPAYQSNRGGLTKSVKGIQPSSSMPVDIKEIWLGDKGVLKTLKAVIYKEFLSPHSAAAYKMEKIGQKIKSLDVNLDANYGIVKDRITGSSNWHQGASAIYNQMSNQRKWLDRQLTDLAEFYVGDTTTDG
ncbi:hypothetical protein PRVXT_000520 [Proteinivorax tanatarense]|uniref:Uncharacterized protein n=1 Tax=Proteinivorax tanatarense TaxID=1260629 RepID=A0AAU7VMW4_9FIRM